MQTPFVTAEEIDALCNYENIIDNQRQVFKNYYLNEAVMGPRAILSQNENASGVVASIQVDRADE